MSLFDYYFEQAGMMQDLSDKSALVIGADPFFCAGKFQHLRVLEPQKYKVDQWHNFEGAHQIDLDDVKSFDIACVSITKSKQESLHSIRLALQHLGNKGLLIVVGANDANGKRITKWLTEFGLNPQSLSKDKHRIVFANKDSIKQLDIISQYDFKVIEFEDEEYITIPGIYGWNKIDMGSDFLSENIPDDLSGIGADFGCGYGFLTIQALSNNNKIKALDMIDSDIRALKSARKNLSQYDGNAEINAYWRDITDQSQIPNQYNFIVMNPPFHEGKKVNSNIGIKFIENAARSLKNKGQLYMVANRHLPYEDTLNYNFSLVEKIAEEEGFKIFKAVK